MRWYVPSKTWLIAPPFEQDERYRDALQWGRDFSPEPDKDSYSAALEFAKKKCENNVSHFDGLDKKADDLMRISVTVAALLVAAVRALEVKMTAWLIASFLCFLFAVILCAIARRPTIQATPGSVREVLGFVEDFRIRDRFQTEALLAVSLHCAVVGIQPQIRWKAEQLSRATLLFVVGIVLLLSVTL
jgi:hypothetical protein